MSRNRILFSELGGPTYIGRPNGEAARKKLKLDSLDNDSSQSFIVDIPKETFNINSSFFLGLFGKSIRNLGSKKSFLEKYKFETHGREYSVIDKSIERALRERKGIL